MVTLSFTIFSRQKNLNRAHMLFQVLCGFEPIFYTTHPNEELPVKADIFGFDIADVGGSIRLFSDVMKRLGIKLDGDELYEEFQRIYDESVGRDADKEKVEDKMWNRGRGR